MSLSKSEIIRILGASGIGHKFQNPDEKFSSYPLAESIKNDLTGKKVHADTGIMLVDPSYSGISNLSMVARFMAYPLRRTVFLCPSMVLYDLLRGNESARLLTDTDERGILESRHLFITDLCRDNKPQHPFGDDMRIAVEEFIINSKYRDNRIVHFHSAIPVSEWKCFSPRFSSFVVDNYKVYATTE